MVRQNMSAALKYLLLLRSGGVPYLYRDDFLTDASAPMGTSPVTRAAEPGPGTARMTQQGGVAEWQIVSGIADLTGTNNNNSYPLIYSTTAAFTRAPGLAFKVRVAQKPNGTSGPVTANPNVGWATSNNTTGIENYTGLWFYTAPSLFILADRTSHAIYSLQSAATNTFYTITTVLRASGSFVVIDGKLEGVLDVGSEANVYPSISATDILRHTPRIATARVAQLGGVWTSDAGIANALLSGARSVGNSFTHQANSVLLDFVLTTLPSAGAIEVDICRQDANNCWRISVDSSGNYRLYEVVAGTATQRLSTTAQAGDRLICALDGTRLRGSRVRSGAYANTSLYSSVSTFTTQTSGYINSLGTGGAISDLRVFPITLQGEAKAWIDAL